MAAQHMSRAERAAMMRQALALLGVTKGATVKQINDAVGRLAKTAGISVETLRRYLTPQQAGPKENGRARAAKLRAAKGTPTKPEGSLPEDAVAYLGALSAFSDAVRHAIGAAREGQLDHEAHRIQDAHRPVLTAMFDLEVALGLQTPRPADSPGRG
jgi:hypothetical protein